MSLLKFYLLMLIIYDLGGLTSNPIAEGAGITRDKSVCTDAAGPPIVASSKYQMFTGDLTERAMSSIARAQDREGLLFVV